jgi:hypothetical protein
MLEDIPLPSGLMLFDSHVPFAFDLSLSVIDRLSALESALPAVIHNTLDWMALGWAFRWIPAAPNPLGSYDAC